MDAESQETRKDSALVVTAVQNLGVTEMKQRTVGARGRLC